MTREIKFRVWDNETSEFWPEGRNLIMVSMVADNLVNDDSTYLEQYTSIKDKNGVEVYEGDIVTCSEGCSHKVVWKQDIGGAFIGGMPGWYLSGLTDGYAWTGTEELLGNVHENPELLEEEV